MQTHPFPFLARHLNRLRCAAAVLLASLASTVMIAQCLLVSVTPPPENTIRPVHQALEISYFPVRKGSS